MEYRTEIECKGIIYFCYLIPKAFNGTRIEK